MVFGGVRWRAESMRYQFVVIFAEDPNDAQALEHLIRYIVPDVGTVRKPRRPLVLMKGRPQPAIRSNADQIAEAVLWEAKLRRRTVDLVVAHQDCDATEPAHIDLAQRIVSELKKIGVPNPVAAAPAWEMEAWWYLWPDAVATVCPSPQISQGIGASGLRIGESSSATKPYGDAEEAPDADRV